MAEPHEACVLEGRGAIADISPRHATGLRLGLEEHLRVKLDQGKAKVEGLDPIQLEGTAPLSSVELHLREDVVFQGVLHAAKNAPMRALAARGRAVRVRPAIAGVVISPTELGCDLLSLEVVPVESGDESAPPSIGFALARNESLRVEAHANGGPGLVLRKDPGSKVSLRDIGFEVIERRASRMRIRAELSSDITIDGWVDAKSIRFEETMTTMPASEIGNGCGYGFAGNVVYRGPAIVREGALLFNDQRPFAKVVRDVPAVVAIVARNGEGESTARELVHIESIAGIAKDRCAPTGATVAIEAVSLPEKDHKDGR